MALKPTLLIMLLFVSAALVPFGNGRKILEKNYVPPPPSADSLYMTALPKGTVPASTPSKKGHASTVNHKLIARHLAATDRVLQSVPTPEVGH
ncbi:hypothetical protein OROGR_003053 [Orobanche gracilis]